MSFPNPSTAMASALLDELVRGGARLAVISPGSRSTALALAAVGHEGLDTVVVLDERSAAFHALGRAKAGGGPALVICTSGTAAANFLPAVVESDLSLTPLVLLTADRPVELRGVGANQTIDQVDLYGKSVRYFADVEAPRNDADGNDRWRTVACTAMAAAMGSGGQPGPVHLNVSFREPTVPVSDDGRSVTEPYMFEADGRPDGSAWMEFDAAGPPQPRTVVPPATRGVVIAGEGEYDRPRLVRAARSLGWPVLATALSGLRGADVVAAYHHVLADGVPEWLWPDTVVAVGAIGPDPRLEQLIATAGVRLRVDRWGRTIDPGLNATSIEHADPAAVLEAIEPKQELGWTESWLDADRVVEAAIQDMTETGEWTGARVVRAVDSVERDRLIVASSLPIRDVDAHLRGPGRVVANRGASGIDGIVSTAMGAASLGGRTLALVGDLSLLHDSNGFHIDVPRDLVTVVVDNDGGGLFDLLPQASHADHFERLFITPPGRDLRRLADFHGISYVEAGPDLKELITESLASGGAHLIRVPVDRADDVRLRGALDEAARAALASAKP